MTLEASGCPRGSSVWGENLPKLEDVFKEMIGAVSRQPITS